MCLKMSFGGVVENRTIRIRLKDDVFRKYKVYCAIANLTLTDQTNKIINKFVEETEQQIKIIKISDSH